MQTRRKLTRRTSQIVKGLRTSRSSKSRRTTKSLFNEASDDDFCIPSEDDSDSHHEPSDIDTLSNHSSPATDSGDDSDIPEKKRRKLASGPVKLKRVTTKRTSENAASGKKKLAKAKETESGADVETGLEEPAKKSKRVPRNPQKRTVRVRKPKGLDRSLPPLHDIKDIFLHMTQKALNLGLEEAIRHLGARRLRVATMCSGTESPLLAMKLIAQSLGSLQKEALQFEHLFSAEIVPYKQAYIERNFQPAIIFRDITEMTSKHSRKSEATTAYGARVPIPGDLDILIAGAACVDFSQLNQHKKFIHEVGESGDTFRAVLHYCKIWRPRIVLLENISGAPWDAEIKPQFERADYEVSWVAVDTKDYYLPQTRERGYMVCVDKKHLRSSTRRVTQKWGEAMFALERRASSSVSNFLLPDDDPRIQQGRAVGSKGFDDLREYDWTNCQARHSRMRQQLRLGFKRPLTSWEAGVVCKIPDYADASYIHKQVERVWDTLDCSLLRKALPAFLKDQAIHDGYDSQFKTRVWELSQNVDRATDTHPFGIAPCITPTGNPYVTDRGGPLTGIESLSVQGLPINELNFTSETQKKLQDLAGNAMSSTVVGSAILSALLAAYVVLPSDPEIASKPMAFAESDLVKQSKIAWSDRLRPGEKLLGKCDDDVDLSLLLSDAERSSRCCYCEGRSMISESLIQVCRSCSHTTCTKCGRQPRHDYTLSHFQQSSRQLPIEFEERWIDRLPMRLRVTGLTGQTFINAAKGLNLGVEKTTWAGFIASVDGAVQEEIRFESFSRANKWTVIYSSPTARLNLLIGDGRCEWQLYARPAAHLACNSALRSLLERPLARAEPTSNRLTECRWEINVPRKAYFPVSIRGTGERVSSWRARLGLMDFEQEKVWRIIYVERIEAESDILSEDVSGTYEILPDCGTASGSLHKRISGPTKISASAATPAPSNEGPLFLFLDPARIGDPGEDCFVFSRDIRRLQYGESRNVIARIQPSWRPWSFSDAKPFRCFIDGQWHAEEASNVRLKVIDLQLSLQRVPRHLQEIGQETDALPVLHHHNPVTVLLSCEFQGPKDMDGSWAAQDWKIIDFADGHFFKSFAWILQRVSNVTGLEEWRALQCTEFQNVCLSCAPSPPPIKWSNHKGAFIPFEDSQKARRFEHALKTRPNIFQIRMRSPSKSSAQMQMGINVHSLVHRAVARVSRDSADGRLTVAWNFCSGYSPPPRQLSDQFKLLNNRADDEVDAASGFQLDLRPDQKRSLSWMRKQEAAVVEPFMLEGIEEVLLPQLRWKAEARARREIVVRGGVLADEPGYGKTITSLALIHAGFKDAETSNDTQHVHTEAHSGLVSVEATLIICPKHLVEQWYDETERCLGKPYEGKILRIKTTQELEKYTVESFQIARIVVVSWDVLNAPAYLSKLAFFAAIPNAPSKSGRPFNVWFQHAMLRLPDHIRILQQNPSGVSGLQDEIKRKLTALANDEDFKRNVPSKRLRGKAYVKQKARTSMGAERQQERGVDSESECEETLSDSEVDEDLEAFIASNGLRSRKSSGWTSLQGPLIHLFKFNRVVVDEFALLEGKNLAIISEVASDKSWVLSGTPPLADFLDVNTIASLLRIKLASDDVDAGAIPTRKDVYTSAEQFHAFRGNHSAAWHEHRHRYAQAFLDRYVRHNIPEIDEIQSLELIRVNELSPNDRALYAELSAYVLSQDMRIKKTKKTLSAIDREKRIGQSLGNCQTPEEALLKRCVATEGQSVADILEQRQRQQDDLVGMLRKKLKQAESLRRQLGTDDGEYFDIWRGEVANQCYGDPDAMHVLVECISAEDQTSLRADGKPEQVRQKALSSIKRACSAKKAESKKQLQEITVDLRKMSSELVTHSRSIRLIRNLAHLQDRTTSIPNSVLAKLCDRDNCQRSNCELAELRVSSKCGHLICFDCLEQLSFNGRCVVQGCQVGLESSNIYHAKDLVSHGGTTPDKGGIRDKITDVVRLLQQIKEKDEQTLLFVQFASLVTLVQTAFEEAEITFHTMDDDDPECSNTLKEFQTNSGPNKRQVLILNCAAETAAGANLFNANHLIFLSPLLVGSQQRYEAAMKQSIARARRYGQMKKVYIHRYATLSTIDVDILEHRERRSDALYADGTVVKKQRMVRNSMDVDGSFEDTRDDCEDEERKERIKMIKDKTGLVRFAPISWGSGDSDHKQDFSTGVHKVSRYFLDA